MKKNIFSLLFLVASILMSFTFLPHQDHVQVNTDTSTIKWIGSKVSESHEGTIKIESGKLILDHGKLVGGEFVIDMNSIDNTDIKEEKYSKKLEDHLKDEDFFNVEKYPVSFLKIKELFLINDGDSSYKIKADLTIKGITHEIEFDADVKIQGTSFEASANIKIDRTKWNIVYNSGNLFTDLGSRLILDDIEFDILLLSAK